MSYLNYPRLVLGKTDPMDQNNKAHLCEKQWWVVVVAVAVAVVAMVVAEVVRTLVRVRVHKQTVTTGFAIHYW